MAHSLLALGVSQRLFNDVDLLAALALAGSVLDRAPARFQMARSAFAGWRESLKGYGPGTIDLRLNRIDRASLDELAQVLAAAEVSLLTLGPTIPSTSLNSAEIAPGVTFLDYPSDRVRESLRGLAELLAGGPQPSV